MNEAFQDKTWELAAAKIHHEGHPAEIEELEDIKSLPESAQILNDTADLHSRLREAAPLHHSSIAHSWQKIAQFIHNRKIRSFLVITRYAAIIVLAFGAGMFIHINQKETPEYGEVYSRIVAPEGQMSEIILYDGTQVWLNSGTTISYSRDFGKYERKVLLEGEAFFKVTSGTTPFKVQLKNHEVEVLGTSFAAAAYPDEPFCQVTLIEGTIEINDRQGRMLTQLEPDQQIHIPDNLKEKIITRQVSTLFYESWIKGHIQFEEERLADVARRLERWYNVEIKFTEEEISNLRFTGTVLKNKPIDQSINAISMLLPIKIKYESNLDNKDVITISKNMPMKKN